MKKNKSKVIHKINISKLASLNDLKKQIYEGEIFLLSGLNEISLPTSIVFPLI